MKARVHTALLSVIAVAMALAALVACGSDAVDESESEPLGQASWANIFDSTQEATGTAEFVVVGRITASAFGRDNGFEVNPTEYTNVTVAVEEVLKGELAAGQTLVLEMIGSAGTVWYEDMPAFGVGERHLLFLRTKKDTSTAGYVAMGPTARYKIEDDGTLKSTSRAYTLTRTMDGRSLEAVKGEIAATPAGP